MRLAAALLALLLAPAAAQAGPKHPPADVLADAYPRLHQAAEDSPRVHAGRDVLAHGRPADGRRSWALVRDEALRLWRALHPAAYPPPPPEPEAPAWWVAAAQPVIACESGGNPAAVSAGGTYTGLLQFDASTWASVGGAGLAGQASVREQLWRGYLLWSQRGWQPWPVCGARAG